MALEAPISSFKQKNLLIYAAAAALLGTWCLYDGYFNKDWIEKHTNPDGTAMTYLTFNRNAPYVLYPLAFALLGFRYIRKDRKLVIDDEKMTLSNGKQIPLSSIESIDKTSYEDKGYFVVAWRDESGKEKSLKLSDSCYDGLSQILDHLITKIS